MATIYTAGEFNYYEEFPITTSNVENSFSFQTSASQIPASNWRSMLSGSGSGAYFSLLAMTVLDYQGLTGILFFIGDPVNAEGVSEKLEFAFNEEAIALPQNAETAVTGTLSLIDLQEVIDKLDNGSAISSGECIKASSNRSIAYEITKTGTNAYSMTWIINETESYIKKKNAVNFVKEDADGTKTVQSIEIMPSTMARWSSNASNSSITNAFTPNLTTKNLAVGGICFDIDEVVVNN